MRFLGCGIHHLQCVPCYAKRSRESGAFFIEHRGYDDLRHAAKGGHDAAAYQYAILLYRDNGGAAADDTVKGYMRRVVGGGSTTSR
jgi:hypothetical protein